MMWILVAFFMGTNKPVEGVHMYFRDENICHAQMTLYQQAHPDQYARCNPHPLAQNQQNPATSK